MAEDSARIEYRCPVCNAASLPRSPSFPFCSKRCRLVDLGCWFEESYRVSRDLGHHDPEVFESGLVELADDEGLLSPEGGVD
jgi:hypothetical protein